jgi:magnesium chelatase family protein
MVARTYSATLVGVNAVEIEIESHDGGGNPKMLIVGLPDASVKESRERVTAAIQSSGFMMNDGVTTVNLAPADLKKKAPVLICPSPSRSSRIVHGFPSRCSAKRP